MKILCEVALNVAQYDQSQFQWLRGNKNFLFSFENKRRLRMFSIKQDKAHEVQSASLAESRYCTSLSWNRDESLLAIVVDKRQLYFWEVKQNNFVHFKSRSMTPPSSTGTGGGSVVSSNQKPSGGGGGGSGVDAGDSSSRRKAGKSRDIEFVAWSKVSDKLAICHASGQILLCKLAVGGGGSSSKQQQQQQQQQQLSSYSSVWEKFIDNSESVLKRIVSIEVSEQADVFVCFSVISEIIIMTFDGETKFYSQGERASLFNAKFSPLHREYDSRTGRFLGLTICLAYQSEDDGVFTKRISLDLDEFQDSPPRLHILRGDSAAATATVTPPPTTSTTRTPTELTSFAGEKSRTKLVDFHWLNSTSILACFSSGAIQMCQLVQSTPSAGGTNSTAPIWLDWVNSPTLDAQLLRIGSSPSEGDGDSIGPLQSGTTFAYADLSSRSSRAGQQADNLARADTSSLAGSIKTQHTPADPFKMFELIRIPKKLDYGQCFALAAGTSCKLFYFELYETSSNEFSFEHFDDIDLGDSLRRVNLQLERARWSHDCSKLSLQLTSGHLLIYRTRLQDLIVASYGPKAAYLSAPSEVTVLNYGLSSGSAAQDETGSHRTESIASVQAEEQQQQQQQQQNLTADDLLSLVSTQQTQQSRIGDKAIILNVQLRPSLLAIGPSHLAVALNNWIRFYLLESIHTTRLGDGASDFDEQEYVTIVAGIGLCSRFVAVQFDDGRLKLHSLKQVLNKNRPHHSADDDDDDDHEDDERFFPDPSKPEVISAFTLTEELLVFCTHECQINIFCLRSWGIVQVCDHSKLFAEPIGRLRPNYRCNKFVCLVSRNSAATDRPRQDNKNYYDSNVYLYDLYSNDVLGVTYPAEMDSWARIVDRQIASTLKLLSLEHSRMQRLLQDVSLSPAAPKHQQRFTNVIDAIWDTDGRTMLLIEIKSIHVVAVLDHTLDQEGPIVQYAASARKPSSYTTLYVSQGIVSFQTSLGRVINTVLEAHDDELKLTRLEMQIQAIRDEYQHGSEGLASENDSQNGTSNRGEADGVEDSVEMPREEPHHEEVAGVGPILEAHLRIMLLKLHYLCTILPIYSLPKCRDICKHLMEDEMFNLDGHGTPNCTGPSHRLVDQMIWKLLAAWSLYTLNMDFASLVYRRNGILTHAELLRRLLDDIRTMRMDSRSNVRSRIMSVLGL